MAGRPPFLNVALPATATAAVAVMSYLLYRRSRMEFRSSISAVDSSRQPDRSKQPPSPIPFFDPSTCPVVGTKSSTHSSPCASPPLFDETTPSTADDPEKFEGIGKIPAGYYQDPRIPHANIWTLPYTASGGGDASKREEGKLDETEREVPMKVPQKDPKDPPRDPPPPPPPPVEMLVTTVPECSPDPPIIFGSVEYSKEGKAKSAKESPTVTDLPVAKKDRSEVTTTDMPKAKDESTTAVIPKVIADLVPKTTAADLPTAVPKGLAGAAAAASAKPGTAAAVGATAPPPSPSLGKQIGSKIKDGMQAMVHLVHDMQPASAMVPLTTGPQTVLKLQLEDIDYSLGYYEADVVPVAGPASYPQPPPPCEYGKPAASLAHIAPSAFDSANHSPSEEMLESPCVSNYSDIHSEESSDSGKGGSDIAVPALNSDPDVEIVYEFELPQDLCGLLIGQHGSTIKSIKSQSQANIYLKRHYYNSRYKLCTITGVKADVEEALRLIRNKFPLPKYSMVTLTQVNTPPPTSNSLPLPDTMQLFLPESIMCDVVLSSLVTANHFFVQQPMHPSYLSLHQLYVKMNRCYSKPGSPSLPSNVQPLSVCAAPLMGAWYRAQIEYVVSKTECFIKYLDYGGYSTVPIASLKQIRGDFLSIPFQASECYLANVKPLNEEIGWSPEAPSVFEELAQGQFLQAQVVGYSENGIPFVHLYRIQGVLNVFINRELVNRGVAVWYDA